jgi:NDP-sugar pyrophosphorylase family protein
LQWWVQHEQPLHGVAISEGFWLDIDRPQDLLALNQHLVTQGWPPKPKPVGTYLPEGVTMEGPIQNRTVIIGADSQLRGPVLVGPSVQIGCQCIISEGSVLAQSTRVADNTVLRQCVTFPSTQVPANADLTGALIDAQGNIVHES